MRRMLIDTNIYSHAFKGDTEVIELLRKADEIGFSVISIGELLSGFTGGKKEKENIAELEEFLDSPRVVVYPVDDETAQFYASVLDALQKTGKPVPTNDVWISATAFQHGLKLFTKDLHFSYIAGLNLV